ncbi:hypothetical protein V7138_14485 [Bacillus sp. JJ1533]|uniref:hypothetical protein n=1 Tax=Bacillus sp. JJ1533 TaxID=3122959 RepID=UPI002FFE9083
MSQFTAVWQFYVTGAVLGLAVALVFVIPAPIMVGNWFQKKVGLEMGIAVSF